MIKFNIEKYPLGLERAQTQKKGLQKLSCAARQ